MSARRVAPGTRAPRARPGADRDPRAVARDVLVRVEDGAYANVLLPSVLRNSPLSARQRAFVTDLVYGTLRAQRRLDWLLHPHGTRPVRRLDPPVRAALRLGVYQLLGGTPPHAAVGETVATVPSRARGYANAVLRSVASAGPPWPEPEDPAIALSVPDWVLDRLTADLGREDALVALAAQNEAPRMTLRPNPQRPSGALAEELRAGGADVVAGTVAPDAVVVRGSGDPATLPAVAEGRATPQDEASQAVVAFLDPRPGERVLDVAAAPGGKTGAIAERVGPPGLVVALDLDPGRLRLVRDGATRLGLDAVATVVADARAVPVRDHAFDRVLVDAPCSGLGVLRRRPDARWRASEARIEELATLQLELVLAAARAVRPGGSLVYSVCTLTATETTGVADAALAALDGFEVLPAPDRWRPHGVGALLLPQDAGTDGMFVVGLRRRDARPGGR